MAVQWRMTPEGGHLYCVNLPHSKDRSIDALFIKEPLTVAGIQLNCVMPALKALTFACVRH